MDGKIHIEAETQIGKVRTNNEDCFYCSGMISEFNSKIQHISHINDHSPAFYAVFDGMGGEAHGEEASRTAALMLRECANGLHDEDKISISGFVADFFAKTNKKVIERAGELKSDFIGSTCVLACITDSKLFVANLGDSRAYYISGGTIRQISKDHTVAQELFESGKLSYAEARRSRKKHSLTRCFGISEKEQKLAPYYSKPIVPQKGDILVLCSDGLTDMLEDDEICSLANKPVSTKEICIALCNAAMEKGGVDNTTVIVISF